MGKIKTWVLLVIPILVLLLIGNVVVAKVADNSSLKSPNSLNKAMTIDHKLIDVNQIAAWMSNDGILCSDPVTGQSGLYYPKGAPSDHAIIYTAGLWLVGKINGEIRSAAADYATEFQPGMILANGAPDDPSDPKYKIFKFTKENWDSPEMAADRAEAIAQGMEDKMYGDQMLYTVYNDFADHSGVWTLSPIGLEVHQTTFGFNQTGAMGNTIFIKYTFINKGSSPIEDAYVAQFFDPDNGGSSDDAVGCDTTLGIGYVYNMDGFDDVYGTAVPSFGCDFFQGPVVPSPGDTAYLPGQDPIPDYKVLPMTSFGPYINGGPSGMTDPSLQSAQGAQMAYWFCSGLKGDGTAWQDPTKGNAVTNWPFYGDPVAGTGWIQSITWHGDDMRMSLASGPFNLEVGVPYSVVVGYVVGQGVDNLSSITVMRFYDQSAQLAYDMNFELPSPPPQPKVSVVQLDEDLILTWDPAAATFSDKGYNFEGYNIYQAPSAAGPWTKIATLDKVNGITTIWDMKFNLDIGALVNQPVQWGKDTGIGYSFHIEKDYLHNTPLINGKKYYFSVTAYAYNPNGIPKVLENATEAVTAIPQRPVLDTKYNATYGDTIEVTHTGVSQGAVIPIVVDPAKLTGHDYKVTFYTIEDTTSAHYGEVAWKLTDVTLGKDLLVDQFHQGTDEDFQMVDGMLVKVAGPSPGLLAVVEVSNPSYSSLPPDEQDAAGAPYGGNNVWLSLSCPDDDNYSGRFFISYQGSYIGDISKCHDYEIRWTADSSWATFGFTSGTYIKVPFELWDIGFSTPDDPSDDVQMMACLYEDGGTPDVWDIPNGDAVENVWGLPCSDRIYFYYVDNAANGYADFAAACDAGDFASADNMWGMVYSRPLGRLVVVNYTGTGDPPAGTTVRFLTNKPNSSADVFTFSTADYAAKKGVDVAKARLDEINVFPNPYFASNKAETDFFSQFITFNNLPEKCTIRIFTLSGQMMRTIEHTNGTPFEKWDLNNEHGLPAASGMYIALVDVPNVGQKILKIAIINRQARYRHM